MNKKLDLNLDDSVWPKLESGIISLLKNLNDGMQPETWMEHYSLVVSYCTKQDNKTGSFRPGEDLYIRLKGFLKRHMQSILERSKDKYGDGLLTFYKIEWERYTTGMKYVDHIFNYLNRYYVKRSLDDGRNVDDTSLHHLYLHL